MTTIKNTIRTYLPSLLVFMCLALVFGGTVVRAQDFGTVNEGNVVFDADGNFNDTAQGGGTEEDDNSNDAAQGGGTELGELRNPLGENEDLESFFNKILDVVLIFATPIIIFFIIYAGFMYVTAGGSDEKIKKATTTFTWAVVGGVLILGAKLLTEVIDNTIDAFKS